MASPFEEIPMIHMLHSPPTAGKLLKTLVSAGLLQSSQCWEIVLGFLVPILGEGNGTPLQYSCLENPMDGVAWRATVHGVTRSQTRLSDFTLFFHFHALEKEMATHASVLAWRIPGTGEPGGLPSIKSHRVGHDWSDLAAAAAAVRILLKQAQHVLDIYRFWRKHFLIYTVFLVDNFQIGLPWMRRPVSKVSRICLNCHRTVTPISTPWDSVTVQALAAFSHVSWSFCTTNDGL